MMRAVGRWLIGALFASANVASAAPPTGSGPLDGTWRFEYSCADAIGQLYVDRCAAGVRDRFSLSIVQSGSRFCGEYGLSAQLKNHVGDGSLDDWTFTPVANGAFHVHYHVDGTVGEAVIRRVGNELRWTKLNEYSVSEHQDGEELTIIWRFSLPRTATLIRQPPDRVRHPPSCDTEIIKAPQPR